MPTFSILLPTWNNLPFLRERIGHFLDFPAIALR